MVRAASLLNVVLQLDDVLLLLPCCCSCRWFSWSQRGSFCSLAESRSACASARLASALRRLGLQFLVT